MYQIQFLKSLSLLLGGIVLVTGLQLNSCEGQCIRRQSLSVPMWEIYGINPYAPRSVSVAKFTPLQSANTAPLLACCPVAQPATVPSETFVGDVPVADVPANTSVETKAITVPDAIPLTDVKIPKPDQPTKDSDPGSISSPSDIILAPKNPEAPTKADKPQVSDSNLEQAIEEIARLRDQLELAKSKARTATERAYAAEKAATAVTENAKSQMDSLKAESDELAKARMVAQKEVEARKKALKKSEAVRAQNARQLRKLELELADSQKKQHSLKTGKAAAKPAKSAGDAQKLVAQLEAAAKAKPKKAAPNKKRAAEQSKKKKAAEKSEKAPENKKGNRKQFNPEKQIKQLNESMQRQLKKSGEQITKRNQAAIDRLLEDGKTEDDPKVVAARKKLKADLKANETKIRKRMEERIQRIKKEAAARAKS